VSKKRVKKTSLSVKLKGMSLTYHRNTPQCADYYYY